MRGIKDPEQRLSFSLCLEIYKRFRGMQMDRRGLGHPLLQQELGRPEHGVGPEPFLHGAVFKRVQKRKKTHALVMRHERFYNSRCGLAVRQP